VNRASVDEDDDELHDDLGLRPLTRAERRRERRRQRGRRARGCFAVVVSLVVIGGIVGALVVGLGKGRDYLNDLFAAPDYTGNGTGEVLVEITRGQSAASIGKTLEDKDVVKSARAFERAARDDSRYRSIQAGTYRLRLQMSAQAALSMLLDPKSSIVVRRVSIPPGKTVKEAAALIQGSKAANLPKGAVDAALKQPAKLGLPSYAGNNPEGFLYPSTYDLPSDGTDATAVLRQMTARYGQIATKLKLVQTAQQKNLDPYDVVIVASLIQAETNRKAEYPKVARVIYNRLNDGIRLQFDSTLKYALGRDGSVFTTAKERATPGPYNTYLTEGLPPTPINSPTEDQLRAALNPATGGWRYFVTVNLDTGETLFASTYAEHNANRAKLTQWCSQHKDHAGCS
jgi:peptidoglycan lytic transglycosylase G